MEILQARRPSVSALLRIPQPATQAHGEMPVSQAVRTVPADSCELYGGCVPVCPFYVQAERARCFWYHWWNVSFAAAGISRWRPQALN